MADPSRRFSSSSRPSRTSIAPGAITIASSSPPTSPPHRRHVRPFKWAIPGIVVGRTRLSFGQHKQWKDDDGCAAQPPGPPMSFGSIFVMHAGVVFVRSESIPTFTQVSLDERGRSYFKLTPVTPGLTSRLARWRRRRPDAASGSRHGRWPAAGAERSNARPDRHRSASPISGCQRGCRSSSRPRPGREVRHQ